MGQTEQKGNPPPSSSNFVFPNITQNDHKILDTKCIVARIGTAVTCTPNSHGFRPTKFCMNS